MIYAFLAYFCWGFFPLYWKLLSDVPALEITLHRVIWSFVFYLILGFILEKKLLWPKIKKIQYFQLFIASFFILSNWLLYIYAVNSGQIIESSLGYFINPFINILLGVFLLKEKLSKPTLVSLLFAAIGVLFISWDQHRIPWIALILAITFALYGFSKKKIQINSLNSNKIEALFFVGPAILYLVYLHYFHYDSTVHYSSYNMLLLMGGGIITGVPLLFFSKAAQLVPLSILGFFQFISPTLQFLSGVLIFNEPLSTNKLLGFILIWSGMLFLTFTKYKQHSKVRN